METRIPEKAALGVVWTGIALVLLMPFVVSGETVFPFLVGKGLYFRSVVEVVFVFWAALAVANPAYRPPRSVVLTLLFVALAVAAMSAAFGVSPVRSFFSTYERMGGVLDQAHWFAFALVLVSVVRLSRWRLLLNANLAVGMVIALWAAGQHLDIEWLLWEFSEAGYGRVEASLGNPIHLGAYVLVNGVVSAGFLASSLVGRTASGGDQDPPARSKRAFERLRPMHARAFWGFGVLLNGWVVTLTGSRAAFLGLAAGFAAVAVLAAFVERRRIRLAMGGLAAVLGTVVVVFVLMVAVFEPGSRLGGASFSNPLLDRVASFSKRTVGTRLAAWDAALDGFVERPVLGWGPENYTAVLGQHATGVAADMRAHDNAHGRLAEELATKGAAGLASHLAIWVALFVVGLRAAKRQRVRERMLTVFAGGALVGYFAHSVVSPEISTGALQFVLLTAFVVVVARETGAETSTHPTLGRFTAPVRTALARLRERSGFPVLGAAGVLAAVILAGMGLWANSAAYSAARAGVLAIGGSLSERDIPPHVIRELFAQSIHDYQPMGNQFRLFLFQYGRMVWRYQRVAHRAESSRLLELMDAEAVVALRREPENWEVPLSLAELYFEVATTNPAYRATVSSYVERLRELAPNRIETRYLTAADESF